MYILIIKLLRFLPWFQKKIVFKKRRQKEFELLF